MGRAHDLAELREALLHAEAGSPSVVLLSGETGVGKTRLLQALVEVEQPVLLAGACVPMAGEPLPFAPLTQALRRLGADHGAVRQQLHRTPELARLLPGGTGSATEAPGASAQLGLFQGVLELLERLGAVGPVLCVVEDIHWADRSSLDLLRYLATNLSRERVVVLASYRADGVITGSRLAHWLAELGRLPVTRKVALERLGPEDTAALVTRLSGGTASRAATEAAVRRSAGNPLYVEQLVRHGGSGPLPPTLSELLLARVAALPPQTTQVLRAAAVLGRPAPTHVVARALETSEDLVEAGIRPAMTQHVLALRGDEVGFTHPAFGEVVYADLLPAERRRLHRGAAEALSAASPGHRRPDGEPLTGELARHWLAAGDLPRALEAAVAAGQAADRMYAFADAHASFSRAVELHEHVPSHHARGWLLLQAAQAAHRVGEVAEAVRLGEAALEVTPDPVQRASLCERLGTFHWLGGHREEAVRWFHEALSALPSDSRSVLAARVYAGLAMVAANWSRLEEGDRWCALGLPVAEAAGARREAGLLHNALGTIAATRGEHDRGVEHLERALALAHEAGDPDDVAYAYINLTHALGLAGRLDEVVAVAEAGRAELTRTGLARQTGSLVTANACEALVKTGRIAEADHLVADALAHEPSGIMAAPVLLRAATLSTVTGDLALAWERCEQARIAIEAESTPEAWMRVVLEVAAEIELWAGRPAAAYDLVIDGLHLVAGTDEESYCLLLAALGMQAVADQAESQRDPASRERWKELRQPLDQAVACTRPTQPEDPARLAWVAAEAARADLRPRPELWRAAGDAWAGLGQPFPELYARWREAESRLDAGVDAEGIAVLRAAHRAATALGVRRVEEEVARLARWHRIDLVAPEVSQPRDAAVGLASYGLTARELEVLGGLTEGRTNREIADDLFISVKTASVHVSNILRKLDVTGRQEAARVAHRLGVGA